MAATYASLMVLDARLVAAGHHPLTPWWAKQLKRFYGHRTAKNFVARVGRGGAKSHTSVKVGVNELLNGDWRIPPGEIHYWCQVSENKSEASERLRLYQSFFTALGVEHHVQGDAIMLPSLRRGVRVLACQIGAVSGFRCFGYCADEAAKWENSDHSANPAQEVCASLDAMTVTHPSARTLVISSPWGLVDFHYTLVERGNTSDQVVAIAPSWVANPSITEEVCWSKAKGDRRIFLREYKAEPGGTVSQALDAADIEAAFTVPPPKHRGAAFCSIDASSMKGDEFGLILGYESGGIIRVDEIDAYDDSYFSRHTFEQLVKDISDRCKLIGTTTVVGDQREQAGLDALFRQNGLSFVPTAWSETNKEQAFTLLRRLLADHRVSIVKHEGMRKEMLQCKAVLTPSGRTQYKTSGLDYLSSLLSLVMARLNTFTLSTQETWLDRAIARAVRAGEVNPVRTPGDPGYGISYQPGIDRWATYDGEH